MPGDLSRVLRLVLDSNRSFRPSSETSAGIRMIRPLLVLFMMLAHVYALDSIRVLTNTLPLNFENWLTVFLEQVLAKTGVPLLSLISGYLAVYSFHRYGYFDLLARKARRLILPMVWANLAFILLITYPGQAENPQLRSDLSIYPFDLYGWFQAIFAFYKLPANQPLFFLKDLFTCFLLLPLLVWIARLRYLNILVIPWMAWKCIYLETAFIFPVYPIWFFRFDIVFAFYLGILLFLNSKELLIEHRAVRVFWMAMYAIVGAAVAMFYVVHAKQEQTVVFLWLDFTVKVVSVLGCISIMTILVERPGSIGRFLTWLSPYSYSMFLVHAIIFDFYHRLYIKWFGWPEFFGTTGIAYLVVLFIVAVFLAVLMKMAWRNVISWAPARV